MGEYMGNHSSILKILQERGRMKFVFGLVALFVAVCSVSAKERAECSFEQAAACVTEIGVAWDSCQSFTNPDEILACMEQIVGATDCCDCVVLDFLPFLPRCRPCSHHHNRTQPYKNCTI